jgi:peptidyl-prolyl cis-trans isomerase C
MFLAITQFFRFRWRCKGTGRYNIVQGAPVLACLVALTLLVSACQKTPSASPSAPQATQSATFTPFPVATTAVPTPTQTPVPLALRVDGEGISVAEFQAELAQLQEADKTLGKTTTPEQQHQAVVDNMVDTELLAQAALQNGFKLDDAALQAEIERLSTQMGGDQALADWLSRQGYTEDTFRAALRRQMAAAWQRDQIAGQVPQQAEQVHARQIVTQDEDIANRALEQVKVPGVNFAAQALRYDPETGGDLGWFPRGYLTQPEVEDAAFKLQPGEISPVVKSKIGYHIVQVIAREASRQLSPDARRVLQHKAIQDWLQKARESGKIEVLLP